MDEEDVVRLFLKNGFQLSKSALPLVLSNTEEIIRELKKLRPRPFIVTKQHVKRVLGKLRISTPRIKLIKKFRVVAKPVDIEEYVRLLHSYYNELKTILVRRMSTEKLVSINKITPKTATFSIIGLVREKKRDNILVEDPSGEVNVYFEDSLMHELKEIHLDDVIGLRCRRIKGKFFVKKVFFPDVPLSREISKTESDARISILTNPSQLSEKSYHALLSFLSLTTPFILLFEEKPTEKLLKDFSQFDLLQFDSSSVPTIFQLSTVKILVLPDHSMRIPEGNNPLDFLISTLKRRRLTLASWCLDERFVLDEIPDLLISNAGGSGFKNYKGTTVIANSNPRKIYTVDLKTRRVFERVV